MMRREINQVVVLGAGSAGLLAALAVRRRCPSIRVRVLASRRIGTIGVGEGTVPYVPEFVHRYLGLDEAETYRHLDPVYKLGVRFRWGRFQHYDYSFSATQHLERMRGLRRTTGYYVGDPCGGFDIASALMENGRAMMSRPDGLPDVPQPGQWVAWHLENQRLIEWLTGACEARGVEFIDGEMAGAEVSTEGEVVALTSKAGERFEADLFVDASGFRAELIGGVLKEPFESFAGSLFCDRAVVGGWDRGEGEAILPYTVSDTMKAGWAWQIDHPERVNRGYVFSSDHLTADEAAEEFRAANPKLGDLREVRFRSGRRRRVWVGNVLAIGNAAGFVEPLEATAILSACLQSRWLADGLLDSLKRPTTSMRDLYNRLAGNLWDGIRDFLAVHYRFNDRLDTPFWRRCVNDTPLKGAEDLVAFYQENGPSRLGEELVPRGSPFGLEGFYAQLVGLGVPTRHGFEPTDEERRVYERFLGGLATTARERGLTMEETRERLLKPETWRAIRPPRA